MKIKKKDTNKNNSVKWSDLLTIHQNTTNQKQKNLNEDVNSLILKKNEQKNKLQQKLQRLQKLKIAELKNLEEIKKKLDMNIGNKDKNENQKLNKDRKIIHLYSNSDPPASDKKEHLPEKNQEKLRIQEEYIKFVETPLVQEKKKTAIKNSKISQQRRMLSSELSEQNRKYQEIKKPIVILFKNQTQKQIINIRKSLNKSDQSEKNSKGNSKSKQPQEKKIRFQTEINERQSFHVDQFHRNTFKKLVIDKTRDNPKNQAQKQNSQKKIIADKLKSKFKTDLSIVKAQKIIKPMNVKTEISINNQQSTNYLEKNKNLPKQNYSKLVNNFIQDSGSKKSSVSSSKHKSVRGFSPGIQKESNHKKVNISIDKLKGSIKFKTETPTSAIVSQNSLSLKQATNIINNIFLTSNFKPKWKF